MPSTKTWTSIDLAGHVTTYAFIKNRNILELKGEISGYRNEWNPLQAFTSDSYSIKLIWKILKVT